MNIKDRRIQRKLNDIIESNLMNGYVPTSREVVNQITNYIDTHNLNLPNFEYTKQQLLSTEYVETQNIKIFEDLQILYNSIIDLYINIDSQINRFETEKKQYSRHIDSLAIVLESLLSQYAYNEYSYIEDFSNMNMLNMESTTANIDIANKFATLEKFYDLLYTDYTVAIPETLITNSDLIECIDEPGVIWQGIERSSQNTYTATSFVFDFGTIQDINRIEINMPLLKESELIISSAIEHQDYTDILTTAISTNKIVHINQKSRYIKITVAKHEADKYMNGEYEYHYLIDTIKFFVSKYKQESVIVTKDITLKGHASSIGLYPKELKPTATKINYYIAINGLGIYSPIKANTPIPLNNITTNNTIDISLDKPLLHYLLHNYSTEGQSLYNLYPLDENTILKNHKLYYGINNWRVRETLGTYTGPQDSVLFNTECTYVDVNSTRPSIVLFDTITEDKVLEYSICLERTAPTKTITVPLVTNVPVTIYLNGKKLYKGDTNKLISFPLIKGVNTITVVMTCHTGDATVDIGLPIEKESTMIRAHKEPMQHKTLFDLKYNTNNEKNIYTIENGMIIVKGLDTALNYKFIYSNINKEIDTINIKAVLSKMYVDSAQTPELHRIEVRYL